MSEHHQQMLDAMRQRGYSVRTHKAYLAAVAGLASHYRRSPVRLSAEEVKDYFQHLAVKRALSGSTCRQHFHAVRFFYQQVLGLKDFDAHSDAMRGKDRHFSAAEGAGHFHFLPAS